MVLKRAITTALLTVLFTLALAQQSKLLLVGASSMQAVYPGGLGVSYAPAKGFARALGLAYWQKESRLILGLGPKRISYAVYAAPKTLSDLKKYVLSKTPPALVIDGRTLIPVRYTSKSLGASYVGGVDSLKVLLAPARVVAVRLYVLEGRDVVEITLNRDINVYPAGGGRWWLINARASEGMRPTAGYYISGVRFEPGMYGTLLSIDGAESWPVMVAYAPHKVRFYIGETHAGPPKRSLIVIDPGHGGTDSGAIYGNIKEKDLVLKIALQTAHALRAAGYKVALTRTSDDDPGEEARASLAEKADVFLSLHIAGTNWAGPGPAVYTSTSYSSQMPLLVQRARKMYASGGYESFLTNYVKSAADVNSFAKTMIESFAKIGVTARRGENSIYLLERSPGAALLVELGSLENNTDRMRLTDSAQQSAFAQALASAVRIYMGSRQ